ncbi:MAG TPA: KH domain-containing protein [Candidatus Dormibacteraeota bacterium]
MTDYADLTAYIVKTIVDDKDAVEVRLKPGGRQTVVEIKVASEDMGKIIGKNGRNIDAIRAVVRSAGLRNRERVQVDVAQ